MSRLGYSFPVAHRPDNYISATANAAGVASGSIGPCPEGFCWYVERMTCFSDSAATAPILEVYVLPTNAAPSDASKQGRQDVATGTNVVNGVSDAASPIVVPAGYYLVAVWTALNSGDHGRLSTQIAVHALPAERATAKHPGAWTGDEKIGDHLGRTGTPADQVAAVSVPVTSDPDGKVV